LKYIENNSKDPFFNLAMEEHLFNSLSSEDDGYFLLWQNEPTIVVGKFQNTLEEINQDFVNSEKVNVVRRISGGGAVYHDHGNLNYTFLVNSRREAPFDFAFYTKPIIDILNHLGVNAAFTSRNDLTIDGKKFSGNAQYMRKGKLLHHGTLLFDSDLDILTRALNVSEDKFLSKGIKSIRSRVTNILPHLPEPMDITAFKQAILENLTHDSKGITTHVLSEKDLETVNSLAEEKYRTWEWNYGSSPEFTEKKFSRFDGGKIEALLKVEKGIITNCRLYGDFFGNGNMEDIEKLITGIPYRKADLEKALEHIHLGHYFKGISRSEFLELMAP
jgi:lipoate-protein ligase A